MTTDNTALLRQLDYRAAETRNNHPTGRATMAGDAAAAIRALEAKVREVERERHDTNNEFAKVLADRDRLDLECARLTVDRGRLAAEVDRQVALCEQHRAAGIKSAAENARLAAEVERLQARIEDAYGWLWCVNQEPGTPHQFSPEQAAYNARKLLRDLLTHEQRGIGINKAVSAARREGEGEK